MSAPTYVLNGSPMPASSLPQTYTAPPVHTYSAPTHTPQTYTYPTAYAPPQATMSPPTQYTIPTLINMEQHCPNPWGSPFGGPVFSAPTYS